MRAAGKTAIVALIAVAGTCSVRAQSGLYGNLTLGVDGATVTGVFANTRPGNGTEEDPQFRCVFVLRGTLANGEAAVTAAFPPGTATTTGTLTLKDHSAKLQLQGEPPGCSSTGDEFVRTAYEEPSVRDGSWTSVRLVTAAVADARQAPVNGSSAKTRMVKDDVVVVYRRIGSWLEAENLNAPHAVRGWMRESDLAPDTF